MYPDTVSINFSSSAGITIGGGDAVAACRPGGWFASEAFELDELELLDEFKTK
jgi:hypothetical protein